MKLIEKIKPFLKIIFLAWVLTLAARGVLFLTYVVFGVDLVFVRELVLSYSFVEMQIITFSLGMFSIIYIGFLLFKEVNRNKK